MNRLIVLGIISMMATVISIMLLQRSNVFSNDSIDKFRMDGASTYFLDSSETGEACSICLGPIYEGMITACECGRISHESCASTLDKCPYCDSSYDSATVRPALVSECPICCANLSCSVCVCESVIPNDKGEIICTCGNIFDARLSVCGICRAFYEPVVLEVNSLKHKHKN